MIERRFDTGFAGDPTDDPGLVMGEDGVVSVVSGGQRTPVGGGFTTVGVVLIADTLMDVSPVGTHQFQWQRIVNNVWDFDDLTELPDGLGITLADADGVATDLAGTDGTLVTTEAGVWAFHFATIAVETVDSTYVGLVSDGGNAQTRTTLLAGATAVELDPVHKFPVDAWQQFGIHTFTPPDTSPLRFSARLEIVRLA